MAKWRKGHEHTRNQARRAICATHAGVGESGAAGRDDVDIEEALEAGQVAIPAAAVAVGSGGGEAAADSGNTEEAKASAEEEAKKAEEKAAKKEAEAEVKIVPVAVVLVE